MISMLPYTHPLTQKWRWCSTRKVTHYYSLWKPWDTQGKTCEKEGVGYKSATLSKDANATIDEDNTVGGRGHQQS